MALSPGTRLGPHEIVAQIGVGGMGEVYKATDTNLKRAVAIKVLPESVAGDAERLARFQREAEVLAALNHPNIAAIYGLERSGATTALVMELVEGPTLADRIAQGAIPIDEALPIAKQIAEALEAAHEQGIIHRDLKPANIKVRSDGTVKVLDFGLAKAMEPTGAMSPNPSMSPTITSPAMMTGVGMILGTAAYMSPEQAKGRTVDKRGDVWAFGCTLFEMLTGRPVFDQEDVSETLAAILRGEPDWRALPAETPAPIRLLLRRCLEKDPKKRLPHIGVARLEIDDVTAGPGTVIAPRADILNRRALALAGAALVVGVSATAVVALLLTRAAAPAPSPVRFSIVPRANELFNLNGFYRNLAISPDGSRIVYVATGSTLQLMVRAIDQLESTPLRGVTSVGSPFFSPDGRWIGYFTGGAVGNGELKKVSITGGPPITLCQYHGNARGGTWGVDGTIIFATSDPATGLMSVSADGGEPKTLTKPDPSTGERDHLFPSLLPGARGVLFTITSMTGDADNSQVGVLDSTSGQRRTLVHGGGHSEYLDTGHLVYASAGTLRAVHFDLNRLEVTGDPVPVLDDVTMLDSSAAEFDISQHGTLVYVPGRSQPAAPRPVVWVDRQGREETIGLPEHRYAFARLSPDGTRLALSAVDQENDVWIWNLQRRTLTRLTVDRETDENPIWTPDGRRVVFSSFRGGTVENVYWQAADGTGMVERLTTSTNPQVAASMSPDGKTMVVWEVSPKTGLDLMLLRMEPLSQTRPLVQSAFIEAPGEISPDGHWLAFRSNESGRDEVYVRPFPNVDQGRWQISNGGGTRPAWSRSGRELVYLALDSSMMAVPVQTIPTFNAGSPSKLFDGSWFVGGTPRTYDVTPDGQRFLMIKNPGVPGTAAATSSITVVSNWQEELKRLVPAK